MYRRNNLPKAKPRTKKSEKNRYRNVIMNFRVTTEEKEKIERRVELSGLTRQEFFIQSLMNQKVICIGNVKSFKEIEKRMIEIYRHINCIQMAEELDGNILESLRMILELYKGIDESIE